MKVHSKILGGKGRKSKLNRAETIRIKRCTNQNPFFSYHQILEKCNLDRKISRWTLIRHLRTIGIITRVTRKSFF